MKKFSPKIVFPLVCLALLYSCKPDENFDDKPFLEYRGYESEPDADPSSGRVDLTFELYFTDGDGDIGTSEQAGDNASCEEILALNNLFVKYFQQIGGAFVELSPPDSCVPYAASIPDITPTGSNPTLEGNIFYQFDPTFSPPNDSIRFEFILVDRSGKESNIATSPSLLIKR
jgi:hypothetical protein